MNLLVKPKKDSEEIVSVTPQSAGWRYVSFSAYQLTSGAALTFSDDANELCAVILSGIVSAKTSGLEWKEIGGRKSVFEDAAPYAIYVPPRTELAVDAKTDVELAVARSPAKGSSSYPPHKHDVDNIPVESLLEETYYHRINPPQGFVFQRVYSDSRDIDESMAVEDRDVVLVPRGYHPVVVPHGYQSYYFNVMAGPKRVWHFHNDPDHEWILSAA
jgi:5-deoxy-glucuronate isomerase